VSEQLQENVTAEASTSAAPAPVTPPRTHWRRRAPFAIGALIAVAVTVAVMGRDERKAVAVTAQRATPYIEDGRISFSQDFAERISLKTSAAEESELNPTIQVTGRLTYDARLVSAVGSRISGRVRAVRKIEGERVTAGEVLAELESIELGRAQAEVLKARAHEQVALAEAARERKLAEAHITSTRDAEHAEAAAAAATAERVAAERTVLAMGGAVEGEPGILQIRSPIAGRVVQSTVTRGQTIDPNFTAFTVADLSKLWVELDVYERDLPSIQEGDEVQIALQARRDQKIVGRIARVGDIVDGETHTTKVRVEIDNRQTSLKPGLAVTATIETDGATAKQLQVPRDAVTRVDGKPIVFVALNGTSVETRHVKLGQEDSDSIAVLEGLKAGEQVVVNGVFALKSEIFR
jgi:cobalt-zinc-cadmium efflux system membrane fusion protein